MVLLVGAESAWRAWRAQPRGRVGDWLQAALLIVVGVTIAGGLGLLIGSGQPQESLHLIYAVLTFGAVPLASIACAPRTTAPASDRHADRSSRGVRADRPTVPNGLSTARVRVPQKP